MKTISIRELHAATGKWVRCASVGAVHVTERGRLVAKIVPAKEAPPQPFFAAPPIYAGLSGATPDSARRDGFDPHRE